MAVRGRSGVDHLLAESFKELAMQRSIEKITIKEITDGAGVIRPTFYNHFQDKYQLLEWIITNDVLMPAQPLFENHMIDEALVLVFVNIEKEKKFYMQAVKLEGQNSFKSIAEQSIKDVLTQMMVNSSGDVISKFKWLTQDRISSYYAKSICYVAMSWIEGGFTISGRELAEIYHYLMRHSLEEVIFGER